MAMRFILIFVCLFVVSCTTQQQNNNPVSEVDAAFKMNYDNCIQIITLRQVDCKNVECVTDYWNTVFAFQCLHAITGAESNIIVNSDAPYFYPTTESKDYTEFFYEDLIRWNDWYEKNKYSMTLKKADSLLQVRSKAVGYEVKWPQSYSVLFSTNPPEPQKGSEAATN
jgi:hypothetical protein